jgi:hypothetical protein
VGGALALTQEHEAAADIQSLSFDTNVVLGTGTVVATFTADEDAETADEAVRIYTPDPLVTGMTEDDCTTSLGAVCAIAAEIQCVGPPAAPPSTVCGQYVPVGSIDGNATPGTFTASFSIDIDCTNEQGLVGVSVTVENLIETDGFEEDDSEMALIHCFPNIDVLDANVIINKEYDGDPAQSFEYQLNTDEDGGGCFVSIDGGPATLLVDGGTFTMTAEDEAWLFCGLGTYEITELQGIGWIFVSSGCQEVQPSQQPIPGSTVTVVIESTIPWDCLFENAPEDPTVPDVIIEKVCVGEADATFTVDFIRGVGPGVSNPIECDAFLYFPDLLAADYTIEELIDGPDAGAIETSIDCGAAGSEDGTSITVAVPAATTAPAVNITCVITNTFTGDDDDPTLPNIEVTKICIDAPADVGDFDITIGDQTEAVPCNGTTSLDDVDPNTYAVSEGDNDAVATAIFCGDAAVVVGTSTEVTIPDEGATDVFCVIINSFDPDALDDLICPCPCGCGLDLEIDVDNTNTNTIGIDNDNLNNNANDNANTNANDNDNQNENNNENTNEQTQDNTQDQNNTNDQTNNITSSPEVNIDFDE